MAYYVNKWTLASFDFLDANVSTEVQDIQKSKIQINAQAGQGLRLREGLGLMDTCKVWATLTANCKMNASKIVPLLTC